MAYHLKTTDDDIDEGCKDKVWAGEIHVIAACLLFNVNITLYILMNNSYTLDMFEVDPSRPTYNLKYYNLYMVINNKISTIFIFYLYLLLYNVIRVNNLT